MKEPVFNIIYIPDTVAYQSVALVSLLLNSAFSFRLVGNSLCEDEARLLESIANCSDRLSFVNFESDFIIPHGTLLDLLFHSEDHPLFCFCDSDIFLFNSLSTSPAKLIGNHHVFSSAGRIENDGGAVYTGFKGGATTVSPDLKIPLATSFFCVYKRDELGLMMDQYKVGFEQYRNVNQVPSDAQQKLSELGLDFTMFDTGKLLSVLLHCEGKRGRYQEIDGLIHIGGMSGRYLQNIQVNEAQEVVEKQSDVVIKGDHKIKQRSKSEMSLKKLYGKYFYIYLHHLIGKGVKPQLKVTDDNISTTISGIEKNIEKVMLDAQVFPELRRIIDLLKEAPLR